MCHTRSTPPCRRRNEVKKEMKILYGDEERCPQRTFDLCAGVTKKAVAVSEVIEIVEAVGVPVVLAAVEVGVMEY